MALSFLWPGLGQWYAGRRQAAGLYAIPAAIVALIVVLQLTDPARLAVQLFDPSIALTALALIVLLGLWRLVAMGDALVSVGGRAALRGRPLGALIGLTAVTLVGHVALGSIAWGFYDAGQNIFVVDPVPSPPPPSFVPSGATTGPESSDGPRAIARTNVLLIGIDSSEIRSHSLTDTMIVVSIDPQTKDVAMLSLPRDIARFPLWDGRTFDGKINSLMTYANNRPDEFPGGGLATVAQEVGYLLGVSVDYYAAINLDGFEKMIDEVGGVTITNRKAINDPSYGGWHDPNHPIGFHLSAGRHTLNGQDALAYARSRKGTGENDFTRARRQQLLLVALEQKLADPSMLPKLPALLQAMGKAVKTNFPPSKLTEMLDLGRGVNTKEIQQYVLGPPYAVHPPTNTTGGVYILKLDIAQVSKLSIKLFGEDSRYATAATP